MHRKESKRIHTITCTLRMVIALRTGLIRPDLGMVVKGELFYSDFFLILKEDYIKFEKKSKC